MPRIDLYRNVHMGQRARLFALAVELGAADGADQAVAEEFADRALAMTAELREHADHEDTHIHPLLRERAPAAADALDAEHIRLDAALAALDERARAFPKAGSDARAGSEAQAGSDARAGSEAQAGSDARAEAQHALYLAVNELISAYLAHLHAEETVAMPALWAAYGDGDLGAVFGGFQATRSPEQRLGDLRGMLPALPPRVRAAIARATVEALPPTEAGSGLYALSTTLAPAQRARLYDDLGAPEAWAAR
ncbi:hemerythrin domain-containing protein [Streptomyces lichenis]|uniref:Hemerythrin domain-containing protein n=1 Tax=Streptomyces lichenis TaxID=2306967 RepID=A0ABT0I6Q1_9ACTN|nr:hemerythrin domain-containing protein [Streptomyces lichenis]MCK8677006.1 hemerythrin domain-containing protein [Streptomyces lichenis]